MENNPKTNVEEKHALYIEARKAELAGLKARLNYYNQLKN